MLSSESVRAVIHLIELIAPPLTLVALFFAWRQFIDARHHTQALKEHTQELGKIENALSTRFMGKFPEYLPEITDLIQRATKSICILCDYPAYCSFTDHQQYERYRNALRDQLIAEPPRRIRMTCLDRARREIVNRQQFAEALLDWDNWKRKNSASVEKLKKHHKIGVSIEELTVEQLFEMFELDDKRIIDDFGGIRICEVPTDIPIRFWIADEREAIFSIPLLGGDALEYGFYTSDNKLITAFYHLSDRHSKTTG